MGSVPIRAVFLLGYQYDLHFRPTGQHSNADGFSRLPLEDTWAVDEESARGAAVFNVHQLESLPITATQLQHQTGRDPLLSKVLRYTQTGWPSAQEITTSLKPYHQRQHELVVEAGCLLWGTKVVVPEKFRAQVLRELHNSHPGIVRMKGLARGHVWWPGINAALEEMVRTCPACQSVRNRPPPVVLHSWPWPTGPWERIHIDYAGPFMGSMFLVVVDAYSKWLEVLPMSSTTTAKTLDALRSLFARYGVPKKLVSDNGPQFTASTFTECMVANGIEHLKSAPYHPATNGEAERFVQTFKNSLKAGKEDPGTLVQKLSQFLLVYRTTPHSTTGVPPTELFLKRQVRTRLDLLKPSTQEYVARQQAEQKKHHDRRSRDCTFQCGESVLALNLREGPRWLPGTIIEKLGPVLYKVRVDGQVWRRHVDQLLLSYSGPVPGAGESLSEELPDVAPALLPAPVATDSEVEAPAGDTTTPTVDREAVTPPSSPANPPSVAPTVEAGTPQRKSYPRRNRVPRNFYDPSFN